MGEKKVRSVFCNGKRGGKFGEDMGGAKRMEYQAFLLFVFG